MHFAKIYTVGRSEHIIDLAIPGTAGVAKYRLSAHRYLNDAFGAIGGVGGSGTVTLFEVRAGTYFQSPSVARRGIHVEESFRERTRVQFDLADYYTAGSGLPTSQQIVFLRVEEWHEAAAAYLPKGPIKIIAPPDFYKEPFPALTIAGKTPGLVAKAGELPPASSMHIVFPHYVKNVHIFNTNSSNSIMVSYGMQMTMMEVTGASSISPDGEFNEIVLANPLSGNAVEFSIQAQIVNSG